MLIRWAKSSHTDLLEVLSCFASIHEMETGQKIVDRLFAATRRLEVFPLSGKLGRIQRTRKIVLRELPYILIYQIDDESVTILNVLHTSMTEQDNRDTKRVFG